MGPLDLRSAAETVPRGPPPGGKAGLAMVSMGRGGCQRTQEAWTTPYDCQVAAVPLVLLACCVGEKRSPPLRTLDGGRAR